MGEATRQRHCVRAGARAVLNGLLKSDAVQIAN